MKYKWACTACQSPNESGNDHCESCGCPAAADGWLIQGWKHSLNNEPEKPSLNSMNIPLWGTLGIFFHKTASCPSCSLHMYIYQAKCPHCGYKLALNERHELIKNYQKVQIYGRNLALIVFPSLLIIVTLISYAISNF